MKTGSHRFGFHVCHVDFRVNCILSSFKNLSATVLSTELVEQRFAKTALAEVENWDAKVAQARQTPDASQLQCLFSSTLSSFRNGTITIIVADDRCFPVEMNYYWWH